MHKGAHVHTRTQSRLALSLAAVRLSFGYVNGQLSGTGGSGAGADMPPHTVGIAEDLCIGLLRGQLLTLHQGSGLHMMSRHCSSSSGWGTNLRDRRPASRGAKLSEGAVHHAVQNHEGRVLFERVKGLLKRKSSRKGVW